MEKISLIAWRRREEKFPDTEAQRRARAREQSIEGGQCWLEVEALEGLAAVTPFELPHGAPLARNVPGPGRWCWRQARLRPGRWRGSGFRWLKRRDPIQLPVAFES
jgi:hypothetical protein